MAETNQPTGEALAADDGVTIPRIALGEQGFVGLRTSAGRVFPESNNAFNYPHFTKTVNEIRHNPTVGSAMNVYRMFISRVNWDVEPHEDADETNKERAKIIRTMMDDMEGQSWSNFIEEAIPYLEYGFGIHEKVLRRRLRRNGSAYNDGLVGIKKLAPRNQDTIEKWRFTEDGADLIGVEQNISNLENSARFQGKKNINGLIPIDREKFLLFTASGNRGNPQGNSIYKAIYLSYKMLTLLQENELVGVAKDMQGLLKIAIPPKYMAPDASAEDKATVAAFQAIIDAYNNGTQRGLLVPNLIDPESKLPLFTYDLMEAKGGARYDVEKIITRLQDDILSALNCDIVKLGSQGAGSFSLASAKTSVLALAIDYRLREMAGVLNNDLMKTLYQANGWSTEKMAKFVYQDIEEISLEEFSSAVQRMFATSAIEMDRAVMNRIRGVFGVPLLPDDMEVQKDKLPAIMTGQETSAGDGMAAGSGEGTRKNAVSGSGDSSVANKANKG
jgi:hypothetical protein